MREVRHETIAVPSLVRIKPGAAGAWASTCGGPAAAGCWSWPPGPAAAIETAVREGLAAEHVEVAAWDTVVDNRSRTRPPPLPACPESSPPWWAWRRQGSRYGQVPGLPGQLPYYAVPTSLSNDGFCSPQSSLTIAGRAGRWPPPCRLAWSSTFRYAWRAAPAVLSASGPGLQAHGGVRLEAAFPTGASRWTTWRRFYPTPRCTSSWTTQFRRQGHGALGTALMHNGIAMEICGSSRPASGSST